MLRFLVVSKCPISANFLFNGILSDLHDKLIGLIMKVCRPLLKKKNILHIYIYIYKKPTLMYVTTVNIKRSHIFFHTDIFRNCISLSVYVCVWVNDTCWKFSIYYKFTKKELLKLTKGITWRHSNIGLKLEKIKFTNTLKNNVHIYIYIYIYI